MLINMDSPKDGERQAQRILSFNRYATLELRINKGSKKGAKNIAISSLQIRRKCSLRIMKE